MVNRKVEIIVAMIVILGALALGIAIVLMAGCGSTGHFEGASAQHELVRRTAAPDGTVVTESVVRRSSGGSYEGESAEGVRLGNASLDENRVYGGGSEYEGFEPARATPGMTALYLLGGVMLAGGIAVAVWASRGLGMGMAVGGLALLVAARLLDVYPWIVLLPVLGLAGLAAYYLFALRRADDEHRALAAIVPAVEHAIKKGLPITDVKPDIQSRAGAGLDRVREAVRRVKKQLGIENIQ